MTMLSLDPDIGWDNGSHDERLYTGDGDWRPGFIKSECGGYFATMVMLETSTMYSGRGADSFTLSYQYHWATHSALCASSNTLWVNYDDGEAIWFGDQDARRDTRQGDWAPGQVKAECGYTEVMTGFAQQQEGINEFRCSPAYTTVVDDALKASDCTVVDFATSQGYDTWPGAQRAEAGGLGVEKCSGFNCLYDGDWNDWEVPVRQGFCGVNRYIKGFAVDSQDGTTRPVKILCCGAQTYPDGKPCNADAQCSGGRCQSASCQSAVPGR